MSINAIITYSGEQLTTASNHAMVVVEVAEYKAKQRKLRQQLEEKTEQLSETKEKIQDITAKKKRKSRKGKVKSKCY